MGKVKSKNKSEVEYLRGENKKLKSQLSSLNRRNKSLEKQAHFYEEIEEDAEIIDLVNCPVCGNKEMRIIDLKYVQYETCDACDYRKKL
jgi:hypothetical protein